MTQEVYQKKLAAYEEAKELLKENPEFMEDEDFARDYKTLEEQISEYSKNNSSSKKSNKKSKPRRALRKGRTKKTSETKGKHKQRKHKPLRKNRTKKASEPKEKQKRGRKANGTSKSKKEKLATPPAWILFIRKFVSYYANKSCKVETLTKYVEALQDKFQSNPKRAKTPNIEILKKIQKILVDVVNSSGRKEKVKVTVSSEELAEMKAAIKEYTIARGKERVYPKFENQELSGIKKKSKKAKKTI